MYHASTQLRSGYISLTELEGHLDEERVQAVFDDLKVDYGDATALFNMLHNNGEEGIDAEEFVAGLMQLRGNAKRADMVEIRTQLKKMRDDIRRIRKMYGHDNTFSATSTFHTK